MLRRYSVTAAAVLLLAALASLPALAQVDGETETPGNSCPPNATPGSAAVASWDTFFECNGSSQWQRGPYFFGTTSDTCDSNHAGMVRWESSISNLQVCDGTTWQAIGNTSNACGSPSGLSFTAVTNASLNTVYTSNTATITFSGCSGALSVSVTGAATAQISVNGGAWTTSGSIYSGQTLQVRLTSSGSVSTELTATVTVASSSANYNVTTRSGTLEVFMTENEYIAYEIGGLSGADADCQAEANTAGYSGTWKAIMSDDSTSAASRLTLSYPIVNAYDGSTVAATNLWAGSVSDCILQPNGGCLYNTGVWSGTNDDGSISTGYTCGSWSNESDSGAGGIEGDTNEAWISSYDYYGLPYGVTGCGNEQYLYCIQQ
ncbi:MAG TPA: hypothetical protein VMF12_18090 [Xanthobacteraceae bacterium]|nr:hypothetical protein [Xanthobacteraceae bacterium]